MAHTYHTSQIGSPALAGRTILFDANALIYNFWPTGHKLEKPYSQAFGQLLRAQNPLAVSLMGLSEVVNRVLRIGYDGYLRDNRLARESLPFKAFRDSPGGQDLIADVYTLVRDNILPRFIITDQVCTSTMIATMLQPGPLDFNDAYLATLCRDQNLVLLSHDRDYATAGIDLLTARQ